MIMPNSSGRMPPTSVGHGNADRPATPSVTMVRNGPDSSDITVYAPTSRGWPYWPISAMYRPPLVSFIAATMASVEMPANTPASTGASPSSRPNTMPNKMPMATLTANSVPPFLRM